MPKACVKLAVPYKTYVLKDLARQRSAAELEHAKPAWTRYWNAMNAKVCGLATCIDKLRVWSHLQSHRISSYFIGILIIFYLVIYLFVLLKDWLVLSVKSCNQGPKDVAKAHQPSMISRSLSQDTFAGEHSGFKAGCCEAFIFDLLHKSSHDVFLVFT